MTNSQNSNAEMPARRKRRVGPLVALSGVSAVALFTMMVLMTLDVIGRELLDRPLPGALELIELTLVVTVFGALPLASWREEYIVADLLDPLMGKRTKLAARAFGCVVGAAVFTIALPHLWTLVKRSITFGDTTPQLGIPISWAVLAILILCTATALTLAARAIVIIRKAIASETDMTP